MEASFRMAARGVRGKRRSESGICFCFCFFLIEGRRFPDKFDMGYDRKNEVKADSKSFCLSNYLNTYILFQETIIVPGIILGTLPVVTHFFITMLCDRCY